MNYWAPNYDFAFVGLQITGGTSPESQTPSKGSVFALRLVTTNRSRVETPVRTTSSLCTNSLNQLSGFKVID